MKKLLFCVFALSALMLSSCSKDDEFADAGTGAPSASGKVTFVAAIEENDGPSPRTMVEISGGQGDITWSAGDAISVVNSKKNFDKFVIVEGAGTTTASFEGEFEEGTTGGNFAIYPAGAHTYNGTTLTVNLPSTYGDTETEYTPNANVLMMAQKEGEGTMLFFKHLGGLLYFNVDLPVGTTSVSLTAKGICGDFTVDMSGANPTITKAADATMQTVTYRFKAVEEACTKTFYFPVPTGEYKDLLISVADDEYGVTERISFTSAQTLERATVAKLKNITAELLAGKQKWVDLGLPSGTLWATCNVGATTPTAYGDHFAWGETESALASGKTVYTWANYKWCAGTKTTLTKYVPAAWSSEFGNNGYSDEYKSLEPEDDAAYKKWGIAWQTPSHDQLVEMRDNTTNVWTTNYQGTGVNGYLFTSTKEGYTHRSIFLPVTGFYRQNGLEDGAYGYYMHSTLPTGEPWTYQYLLIGSDYFGFYSGAERRWGMCVRPVVALNDYVFVD